MSNFIVNGECTLARFLVKTPLNLWYWNEIL